MKMIRNVKNISSYSINIKRHVATCHMSQIAHKLIYGVPEVWCPSLNYSSVSKKLSSCVKCKCKKKSDDLKHLIENSTTYEMLKLQNLIVLGRIFACFEFDASNTSRKS